MSHYIPFDLELYRNQMQVLIGDGSGSDVFWRALDYAVIAHDDQWRKSGDAYILHPCSVAKILADEMDVDHPEILAAALLHDTVEDVEEVTLEVVEEKFGGYVRAIVEGCTKVTHVSGDRQTVSRKTHRKIFSGAALRPEVILVKLADRLHNLRTLRAMPQQKRQRIADETLAIYAPLAGALGLFNMKREMYDLALFFKFPRQGARLNNLVTRLKKSPLGKRVASELQQAIDEANLTCEVEIRTKGLWAYYDVQNKVLLQQIDTPQEIILQLEDISSCYSVLGVLNQTFAPIPRTIRDFITNPKQTGYQGLHSRAIIEGQKFFFKIRTREMARKAQRGLFKNWTSKKEKQGRFIQEIQEMFDVLGSEEDVFYRDVIEASGIKEIYTYTPKGDLIYLPKGSSVLDFAFCVHTEVGLTCKGAMIRNKKVSPSHILQDGNMVRILRANEPVRFAQDMLQRCKTHRARGQLARSFRKRRGIVTTKIGKLILEQELARYGLALNIFEKEAGKQVISSFSCENFDDFCRGVGERGFRLRKIMTLLAAAVSGDRVYNRDRNELKSRYNRIELTTLDPVTVKLSSCCKPDPTSDENLGLLTRVGISVHKQDCPRFRKLPLQPEDVVSILWEKQKTRLDKSQTYHIPQASRKELMAAIATAPEDMKMEHLEILSKYTSATPAWELVFSVADLQALQKVNAHFMQTEIAVEFVLDV